MVSRSGDRTVHGADERVHVVSARPPVALLLVGAAAVVAAISWWVGNSALHADAQPVSDPPAMDVTANPTEPLGPLPSTTRLAADAPLEEEDDGFGEEDLSAHISDPANSDLPPDLFTELTQLGVDVVRADVTAEGRDRWPEYWRSAASERTGKCCADVVIHAAGGFTDPTNRNVVIVTVIWEATDERMGIVRVSHVALRQADEDWSPTRA